MQDADLLVSNFALSFCSKEYFNIFWEKVVSSIRKGGYIVGNIFGEKDEWNKSGTHMTFLNREKVLDKLKDFEIIRLYEKEFDGKRV